GRYSGDGRTTEVRNPIAGFAAMMTKLDDDIGALLALLAELGIENETIVMLSSDNGPHREGGHDPGFWNSSGPLRGGKRSLYDGGIRVPFLARWPGRIAPGRTSEVISAHWDVLPTLCELAGTAPRPDTDGVSLVPTLTGEGTQVQHEYLYWEFYELDGKRALRMGRWKAVRNGLRDDPAAPIELYDLAGDVGESHDVAAAHPDIVARAEELFRAEHTPDSRWQYRPPRRR
ncbi:MAG: sulfatase-like hydrolase/transferase, partial [Planctomycetes bacterium]|nr:sulfatase-like hydrolase/transferase [Planctomycetota bacterium]